MFLEEVVLLGSWGSKLEQIAPSNGARELIRAQKGQKQDNHSCDSAIPVCLKSGTDGKLGK